MTDDVAREAREFYDLPEVREVAAPGRGEEVLASIARSGTYRQTGEELTVGARLAFRNHARCVGRSVWRSLVVRDRRRCATAEAVAASAPSTSAWRPTVAACAPSSR